MAQSLKSQKEPKAEIKQPEPAKKQSRESKKALLQLNETLEQLVLERTGELHKNLKEVSDYKYALDESSIVAITDQKGIIKYANDNFCKISRYSREELIGQDHHIINSGFHSKEFIRDLWVTIANGKIWRGELKNEAKDGTIYWVDTTITPFLDEQGKPYKYVAIRADITKRKAAEELLLQLTTQLKAANRDLTFKNEEKEKRAAELIIANNELAFQSDEKEKRAAELIIANKELAFQNDEKEKRAAQLIIANKELAFQNDEKEKRAAELIVANKELAFQNEEKEKRAAELVIANKELAFQNEEKEKRTAELIIANKELGQFAYIASHDLQEPLRTISNYMQVFEEDYSEQLDDNAHKYILSVNNATKRMSLLVRSLLDFSRLGRDKKLAHVDFKKIINDVIADLQTMIKNADATITVAEMPVLNVYEVEIGQLFQNLITNAIKFQKKDSRPNIQILSKKVNENWQFSVSDNGIGIEPDHFHRVFDIFQRLHTGDEYQGNGIGLANCKKIVELHQGEIWVESTPAMGSTFNFTIHHLSL